MLFFHPIFLRHYQRTYFIMDNGVARIMLGAYKRMGAFWDQRKDWEAGGSTQAVLLAMVVVSHKSCLGAIIY